MATNDKKEITDISAGDIIISHIEIVDRRGKLAIDELYDGAILEVDIDSLEQLVFLIDNGCIAINDGCRVLVVAKGDIKPISDDFMKYLEIHSLEDVRDSIHNGGGREALLALLARTLGSRYHVAIDSDIDDELIKKCGWNVITQDEYKEFMQNCNNIIDLTGLIDYDIRYGN